MRHISNQKCFGHCLRLFSSLPAMKEPAQNVRREKGRQQRQHLLRMIRSQQSSALPACAECLRASQRALGARKRVPPWNSTVPYVNGRKSKEAGQAGAVRKEAHGGGAPKVHIHVVLRSTSHLLRKSRVAGGAAVLHNVRSGPLLPKVRSGPPERS